jgi:hypothetical protein
MSALHEQDRWLLLAWLILTGLSLFGLVVCWHTGLIDLMIASDRSRICLIILLLYVIGAVHCARRTTYLADQLDLVRSIAQDIGQRIVPVQFDGVTLKVDGRIIAPESVIGAHLSAVSRRNRTRAAPAEGESSTLVDTLVARVKGPHELGWFAVDALLKLGLLGTIVGFILMLGSVADTASLDVNTMQKVLKQMSYGMGTALYTTLAGLVGSMALGLQYLLLDKGADALIERILGMADSQLAIA